MQLDEHNYPVIIDTNDLANIRTLIETCLAGKVSLLRAKPLLQ